jgi:hypothetical protein
VLRECLVQVRYVAATRRPGKGGLWVSRELRPPDLAVPAEGIIHRSNLIFLLSSSLCPAIQRADMAI